MTGATTQPPVESGLSWQNRETLKPRRVLDSCSRTGRGVAQDDTAAVAWFNKSAVKGNVFAQTSLGVMYEAGRGVAKDDAAAAQWYRRAAEQGFPLGQNNLGVLYRDGHGVAKDAAEAVHWFRKAADQVYAKAQTNLGRMYQNGSGVAKDEAAALEWFQKAAKQGDTTAQAILASIGKQERAAAPDSAPAIAALVKKYEAAQPALPVPDAERAALAREIVVASRASEKLSYLPERFREGPDEQKGPSKLPPALIDAIMVTGVASFRPDRILVSWERWLAEGLDAPTLRVGLQWERSDLGRRINRLELEAEAPEQYAAKREFTVQFAKRGATGDDSRGRACAQKDILDGSADAVLPFLEAVAAAGAMMASVHQAPSPDIAMVEQMIVAIRPMLRDTARQTLLADCAFTLRSLSDAEFDQLLDFLRTDGGGRYARGSSLAMRRALLEVAEVFTRTLVDVARQFKKGGQT